MYIDIAIICVVAAAIIYLAGYNVARKHTEAKFNDILKPFKVKDVGMVPRLLTDKSGRDYNGCNSCGKKVWKPMQFCPYCAQRINWNFIRIKTTNFDAT